jgi:cell division transport system ATP-binding protein
MKVDNLVLSYGNKTALRNVNIEIQPWEYVFIIWYSGSGKTSLIRSMIGDLKPTSGNIFLDNGSWLYSNKSDTFLSSYRRSIGVIFQDYKLLESKKVFENVAFAMEVCGYKDGQIQKKVSEALEQVWLLFKKDKYIYELSGWEKQRVAIARSLVHNPKIIIGDEPTGNLDPETAEEVMDIFDELNREWITIIMATHDKAIVNKYKKRVIAFKDKEVFSDTPKGKYCL